MDVTRDGPCGNNTPPNRALDIVPDPTFVISFSPPPAQFTTLSCFQHPGICLIYPFCLKTGGSLFQSICSCGNKVHRSSVSRVRCKGDLTDSPFREVQAVFCASK